MNGAFRVDSCDSWIASGPGLKSTIHEPHESTRKLHRIGYLHPGNLTLLHITHACSSVGSSAAPESVNGLCSRGRPRTAALRQKSARVLGMETSDRRGRRSTEVLREQTCVMWRAKAYRTSCKKLHRAVRVRPLQTHARTLGVAQVSSFLEEEPTRCGCRYRRSTCAKRSKQMSISSLS